MLELLLTSPPSTAVGTLPPGPPNIIAGNTTNGLYGVFDSTDFFTGSSLASAVGVSGIGTLINDTTRWVKASLDGKIVYYPMLPIRHGLSWNMMDTLGMRTREQNKRVSFGGRQFIVRLFTGTGNGDAALNVPNNLVPTAGSDFNRLIYRVCAETPPGVTVTKFANFSLAELGLTLAPGTCFICQEAGGTNNYIQRNGGTGTGGPDPWYSLQNGVAKTNTDQYRGWRPILELV
jgi:hypothetical protein